MAGKRRRPSKSNRRGMVAIAGIVMVLLVGLLVQSQQLTEQNALMSRAKRNWNSRSKMKRCALVRSQIWRNM